MNRLAIINEHYPHTHILRVSSPDVEIRQPHGSGFPGCIDYTDSRVALENYKYLRTLYPQYEFTIELVECVK